MSLVSADQTPLDLAAVSVAETIPFRYGDDQ
jgi:hypothetical protein